MKVMRLRPVASPYSGVCCKGSSCSLVFGTLNIQKVASHGNPWHWWQLWPVATILYETSDIPLLQPLNKCGSTVPHWNSANSDSKQRLWLSSTLQPSTLIPLSFSRVPMPNTVHDHGFLSWFACLKVKMSLERWSLCANGYYRICSYAPHPSF